MTRDKILNQAAENAKKVQEFSPGVRELLDRRLDWDDSDHPENKPKPDYENGITLV